MTRAATPSPKVRPTAMVKAVLRQAAALGYDAKLNPDGSLELIRPASPQSTGKPVAKRREVIL